MNHNYICEGENIILKPMSLEESQLYRCLRNRDDVKKYFFYTENISEEAQNKWYLKYKENQQEVMFSIYEKDSNDFLGGIGIYDINNNDGTCEIGRIIIDKQKAKGKGYGAKALILLSEFAVNQLNMNSIYAYVYSFNDASSKSFINAGYKLIEDDTKIRKYLWKKYM